MVTWKCKLKLVDKFAGKVPSDPEALKYVIMKRAKEAGKRLRLEEAEMLAREEAEEVGFSEIARNTFYKDEQGLYIKPMDIRGMLKERLRQLGISVRKRGWIMAIEGLRIEPLRIYVKRKGKIVRKPDGTVAKPIHKPFGAPAVSFCDYVDPPCMLEFTIEKLDRTIPTEDFEKLLKSCFKLGGLRKEYGTFEWVKVKRIA